MQGFNVYPTQGGTWAWFILPKWASLPGEPCKGNAPDKEGAESAAKRYIQRASSFKLGIRPQDNAPALPARLATPPPPVTSPNKQTETPHQVNVERGVAPLYVMDAHTYIYRAFHAVPQIVAPDGTPVNALSGFLRILLKLLKTLKPEKLAVVFDSDDKTFRHDIHPEYKAGRETPPELVPQLPIIKKAVESMGICCIEMPGYEADDVMGTLATRYPGKVILVGKDKDLMQTVSERVSMLELKDGSQVGVKEVNERFGVDPDRVIDILALAGDSVDNIPGVPGIGEKTAAKLIAEFGTIDALLDRACEVKGKIGEKLVEFAGQARLSYRLASIITDAPVNMTGFEIKPARLEDLEAQLNTYVPDQLIGELARRGTVTNQPDGQGLIGEFRKQFYFLSNFFASEISYGGKAYPTAEHLFQSLKTTDPQLREKIRLAEKPGDAKRLGRALALREDWESIKLDVMREVLRRKFSNPSLKERLLATGSAELVEGNTWNDTFWGVCDGKGENWLGKLLMELRRQFAT